MKGLVKLMLIAYLSLSSIHMTLARNGVVVIEIQKDVPASNCSNFLLNLENVLMSSAEYFYSTFNGHIRYSSFDIILPTTWSNECVLYKTVKNYNGVPPDVTITKTKQIFGDSLWTQHSRGCGEKGDQVFVTFKSFENENIVEQLSLELIKYRFGVFDLSGLENDSDNISCITGTQNPQCNDLDSSKHNFLCYGQKAIDVIMRHADYKKHSSLNTNDTDRVPIFNYLKRNITRYVVIVDDHIDISVRDSFQFLRDAMRKWIEKDLDNKETEVGILLLGNITKSVTAQKNLMMSLLSEDDREEIFSALPWYIETRIGPKCVLNQAIEQSIQMMNERSRTHGDATNVVLIIAPGMYKCSDNETTTIINAAQLSHIKISTINYPSIGPNRVEMDSLAKNTGGESFTVIEKKQNEEESLLTTFFELTNTLMHISSFYHQQQAVSLPVEIYRKKLIDTGSREENRATSDSFTVDEETDFINFFVYIYDRKARNIEKGMKLVSPSNNVFLTSSELRAEYHQIQIVGNLTGFGSWSYNIRRFFGNPQPHFVQVLAHPKTDHEKFIRTSANIKRSRDNGPHIIYVYVKQGNLAIVDALVEVSVKFNGRQISGTRQLFDSGSLDPDVTRGDGVYSGYYAIDEPGMYTFDIMVTDNGNTAYTTLFSNDGPKENSTSIARTVTPFQRNLIPLTIFVDSAGIELEKTVLPFIGRIGDLTWRPAEDYKIILEWSGPDVGRNAQLNYEIHYSTQLRDISENNMALTNKWQNVDIIPHNTGQRTSLTINLADELSLIAQVFYIVIKSTVLGEFTGPISNVIRVFVPKKRTLQAPKFGTESNNVYEQSNHSDDESSDDEGGITHNLTNVGGLGMNILISILFSIIAVIVISICCCICICRTRKKKSLKSKFDKTFNKQEPSISVVLPHSNYNKQIEPMPDQLDGSMYHADPNHHTVGLPIYEDSIKAEYFEHERTLLEDMHSQRRFQQQAAKLDHYEQDGSYLMHNEAMPNDVRYLSPFESWTASHLLHEHERRQSPIQSIEPSLMYIDANGDLVPELPALPVNPYGRTYDNSFGDVPPPQYSTVFRPLIQSLDTRGSLQSVSGTLLNGEKKVRNITMV